MADYSICIPDGYRILEKTETVDIFLANQWLTTKKQHRYTGAVRNGDLATLRKSVIRCPHCGRDTPAYARFTSACFDSFYTPSPRLSRDAVDSWASPQYSFCPQETDTLVFNRVFVPEGKRFTCPHCGLESREHREDLQVTVSARRGKVILSCRTHDLGALLRVPWARRTKERPLLPLEERVEFNLKTGKSWISLRRADGALLAISNIYGTGDGKGSTLFRLMEENLRVKRVTLACFRRFWEGEFPFGAREITPQLFILLCRHVGFPRTFYTRTPLDEGTCTAARSFRSALWMLHTPARLQQWFCRSSLPQTKSVRRLLFQAPEHAFYLPELEFLYRCMGNIDLFAQLFDRPFTFELLAFLHQYPYFAASDCGPGVFFRDYAALRSPRALLTRLENRMGEVRVYAIHYGCLPRIARKREQQNWVRESIHCCPAFPYSVPMRASRIPDTTVDGFDFVLLKNLDDCHKAGTDLHNCLTDWEAGANPVFAVKKKKQYLAAIEVCSDSRVLQAYTDHNKPLILIPKLYLAYRKWMGLFGLSEADEDAEDEIRPRPRLIPLLENTCF